MASIAFMPRPLLWLVAAGIIVTVVAATLWTKRPAFPRVPLGGDRELRVLKVSFGTNHVFSTESFWKQYLRRVLPQAWHKPLGPFPGHRLQTRCESLVVWVGVFDQSSGAQTAALFDKTDANVANGSTFPGRLQAGPGGLMALEFPWYARDQPKVRLQVWQSARLAAFTIENPSPARPAVWQARPVPQTNRLGQTEIVLRELRLRDTSSPAEKRLAVRVGVRGLGESPAGWMSWPLNVFDRWGNWGEGYWLHNTGVPSVALPSSLDSNLRLLLEGQEYVSAGIVPSPTNGSVCEKWILEWATPNPGVPCLCDSNLRAFGPRPRLRERIEANGGRIFGTRMFAFATNSTGASPLFAPGLPAVVTNLEVEIIASLPPADFYVKRPER